MTSSGKFNAITDVEGILVGHHTDQEAASGVTAVLCKKGAVAGVEVRGSAPGTRETDLLSPENLVENVQAIVLSGGSVFGLSAADGAVRWLHEKGLGFPLDEKNVAPIVPAAVLFDLGRGKNFVPPINAKWGRWACEAAGPGAVETGCVGAATGALSGGIKGGLGTASAVLASGITVAALVAVNSLGSVINPKTGRPWEIGLEESNEFGDMGKKRVTLPVQPLGEPAKNTSIGVIATDAVLTKAQARKIAQMAHDGLGRTIRPCHTMFDGDTLFAIATGENPLPEPTGFFDMPHAQAINDIGHAAADCVSRAVIHGVLSAKSGYGITAFGDLEPL